ncbi:glutamate-5-semialdehyde dehydrogenase [Aspergillus saccharolyticus JOP 1030-1]|uniref:glutamate-5-semialdehyde dehydrogenase n=1 Tax=Aspergillus saccharolyticus JOP 1030-1 TaxID=1450539 RepID=A0A318ZZ56_9EURO|nr:glutamate semialdehyde dehydrogenase [Aspergillus saccharolyticus JOP 1030-1]PYH40642.1 glutamate semialdehyde dehydrogenase [Aspergillus saccharolyticus JOP 1030-1]
MSLTDSSAAEIAKTASMASRLLATLPGAARNDALSALHEAIANSRVEILEANSRDVAAAERAVEAGVLNGSVLKRLDLSRPGKFEDMLQGILSVKDLDDPVGIVTMRTLLDDDLTLEKVSCPIGVLLIIFEARPEVIANIAALSIKSGNAAILKGGKESTESFITISKVISKAIASTRVPKGSIQLVETREAVSSLLAQDSHIDLVIPRGSKELVRFVQDNTKIPVLGHADGLCSAYIHADADLDMAVQVIVDSKTNYPAACNSLETLLVHEDVLQTVFPAVAEALFAKGVALRCDPPSKEALASRVVDAQRSLISEAVACDYKTEFLDLVLAVKTIPSDNQSEKSLDAAIVHINNHSSKHTDIIITKSASAAEHFMNSVDSAGVFWNASTRFADGMRYGFGTEVGISTNKIHSRGPVGLDGLTIYKYKIRGQGQKAGDYSETGCGKRYKHKALPL